MELDDLRRQWQRPEQTPNSVLLDNKALKQLLAHRSGSPVMKMRRNAWLEALPMGIYLLSSVWVLLAVKDAFFRVMSAWMVVICLLGVIYLRYKLLLLKRLHDSDQPLRSYVAQQLAGLRSLVKLYYRASLWSLVPSLGIGLVMTAGKFMTHWHGPKLWIKLGLLLLFYVVGSGVAYLLMRWVSTWYLQRLYGQHLDLLESQLRELDEAPDPPAS